MKTCTKCSETKAFSEFYLVSKTKKPRAVCKKCHNAAGIARAKADPEKHNARSKAWRQANPEKWIATVRAWQKRNPEQTKKSAWWSRYRIDFHALWDAQEGLCACCGGPMLPDGREPDSVTVDHDRSCCPGKKSCGQCVRGLIHRNCNLVLGYAKDDLEVLRGAVAYLERWADNP